MNLSPENATWLEELAQQITPFERRALLRDIEATRAVRRMTPEQLIEHFAGPADTGDQRT